MEKRLFPLFLALLLLLSACGAKRPAVGIGGSRDSGSMPDDANGWTEDASANTAESGADFFCGEKECQADFERQSDARNAGFRQSLCRY
ncbi:MAG: hypothetical protein ACLUDF_04770 [Butyricicoccus sp.]